MQNTKQKKSTKEWVQEVFKDAPNKETPKIQRKMYQQKNLQQLKIRKQQN